MLAPLVSFVEKRVSDMYASALPIAAAGSLGWAVARVAAIKLSGISPAVWGKSAAGGVAAAVALLGTVQYEWFPRKADKVRKEAQEYGIRFGTYPEEFPHLFAALQNCYINSWRIGLVALVTHLCNRYILPLSMRSESATALAALATGVCYAAQPFCDKVGLFHARGDDGLPKNQAVTALFLMTQTASRLGCSWQQSALPLALSALVQYFARQKPVADTSSSPATVLDSLTSYYTRWIALATASTYALNRWALPTHLQSDKAAYLTLLVTAVYYGMKRTCDEADEKTQTILRIANNTVITANKKTQTILSIANRVIASAGLIFYAAKACDVIAPQRMTNRLAIGVALIPIAKSCLD